MSLKVFLYLSLYVVLGCVCKATEILDSQLIMDIRDKLSVNQPRKHHCDLGFHFDQSGNCVCPTSNYCGQLNILSSVPLQLRSMI